MLLFNFGYSVLISGQHVLYLTVVKIMILLNISFVIYLFPIYLSLKTKKRPTHVSVTFIFPSATYTPYYSIFSLEGVWNNCPSSCVPVCGGLRCDLLTLVDAMHSQPVISHASNDPVLWYRRLSPSVWLQNNSVMIHWSGERGNPTATARPTHIISGSPSRDPGLRVTACYHAWSRVITCDYWVWDKKYGVFFLSVFEVDWGGGWPLIDDLYEKSKKI